MAICLSRQVTYLSLLCCCPRKSNYFHSSSPRIAAIPPCKRRKSAPFRVGNRSHCESSVGLESPLEGYRKNVGICLINPEKKVFGARRLDSRQDAWQMPQGGMDDDEYPRVDAMRELREETGVVSVEVVAEGETRNSVGERVERASPEMVESSVASMKSEPFITELRFLLKFTGKDEEVNLQGDGAEKAELRDWAWMKPDDLIMRSVEFVRPVYKQVFSALAPHFQ